MILLTDSSAGSSISMIVILVAMIAVMYFLMIRPQNKGRKRTEAMLSSMEIGDAILTSSGFYGVVIDMTDEDVIVEFGNNRNCRIPMKKAAIIQVEKPEGAGPAAPVKEAKADKKAEKAAEIAQEAEENKAEAPAEKESK